MGRVPMSSEGYRRLSDELKRYVEVERPKNVKAIAEARAFGDLSENAEYHAAKERQGFIEKRIRELQGQLSLAEVVEPDRSDTSRVSFGATVSLIDVVSGKESVFTLVGDGETDVASGRVSILSPVGRALLGKEVGESVVVETPAKTLEYEVQSICFI